MKKIVLRTLLVIGVFILVLFLNLVFCNVTASRISEGLPIPKGSDQTALLVIDIQEGTTGDVSFTESYQTQSEELIRNINLITDEARRRNWSVIYIRSEVVNPLLNLLNSTLARGSEGAALDKRLTSDSGIVVTKRKSDAFNKTELDQVLREKRVGRLVLVGLDAEHCVLSTIQAAQNRNYRVSVIREAVIAKTDAGKAEALNRFRSMGVEVAGMDSY